MFDLQNYDLIIFDCDGVLIDSNNQKCDAFKTALAGYPKEIVNSFIAYHKENGGVSRYVKLNKFFSDFLSTTNYENEYNRVLQIYNRECLLIYKTSLFTPGCIELLNLLIKSNIKLYVASGSDEKELKTSFKYRNIDQFFQDIYGSPSTKSESVSMIINKNPNHKRGVIIGDSYEDYRVANEHELEFIYMKQFSEMNAAKKACCEGNANKVIYNLQELL